MIVKNLCVICEHLQPNWKCAAFPGGISNEILLGKLNHKKQISGDHGIVFQLRKTNRKKSRITVGDFD